MKKIALFIAAAAMAVSASAQKALTSNKVGDNIYIGGALGAETLIKGDNSFAAFNPNATVIVGKNFTTVFGLRAEGVVRFNAHKSTCNEGRTLGRGNTGVNGLDVNLLGTFNLMNLFGGYKGTPRDFEVIALYGFGWGHEFNHLDRYNTVNSKFGVDFAYNFGKDKQYQIFLEPSLTYTMLAYYQGNSIYRDFKYNANNAVMDLKVGFVYKFKNSNGKHNFAFEQLRSQAEIDSLNAVINGIRGDIDKTNAATAASNAEASKIAKALSECQNRPVVVEKEAANLQPSVVFAQGKSNVEKSQMANIDMIAKYMKSNPSAKVKISGYASPEGSKELNQKLSEARANNVKDVLIKKYKISADRLEAEGLGATDKLFDEVEFNRVALFNDTTKE